MRFPIDFESVRRSLLSESSLKTVEFWFIKEHVLYIAHVREHTYLNTLVILLVLTWLIFVLSTTMWTLTFSSMSITCLSCVDFYCMFISTATQVSSTRSQLRLSESPLLCILVSRSALLHDCAMACSSFSLIGVQLCEWELLCISRSDV